MINMNVFIQMAQSVKRQTLSQVQYFCSSELHSWKLDPMLSVLGSELHAIQMAIEIVDTAPELICKNVVILTDSRTACLMVLSPTDSYVSSVDLIWGLLITSNRSRSHKIQWIKAHAGIEGNETVDIGAKSAHH